MRDLRKLNSMIQKEPHPLLKINYIIWKMSGFTYATCLDLNHGYYYFKLDRQSLRMCEVVLSWETYCYRHLAQGLMISSDIFQQRISSIFSRLDDVIVYVDNIFLYTKSSFTHHVHRFAVVLQVLK